MSTRLNLRPAQLVVRRLSAAARTGVLECGPLKVACALGKSGTRSLKREGDGATPRGRMALEYVLIRPGSARHLISALPVKRIRPSDGWCDDACDRNYNRPVTHPYPASAERLWRDDGLYDIVVVLGYNLAPRIKGKGSAIFMHVARPGYLPTEGCIALARNDLIKVLARVRRGSVIITNA